MKIVIASDKSGFDLKEVVKKYLEANGYAYEDLGPATMEEGRPFFETASRAAEKIGAGEADRGILICGTGMGMSQVANKHPGVLAACCENVFSAAMCRAINNSNVLCMGGWVIGPMLGEKMVKAFLETEHTEGLEEWRQEFLKNAYTKVCEIDAKNLGGREA